MTSTRITGSRGVARSGAVALAALMCLAACSKGSSTGTTEPTSTSTLPPLPPNLIAYVALAGSGSTVGNGSTLVEVTLSPPPEGISSPIRVGTYPDAVAVAPGGRLALVANYSSNTVTPIVLPSNKVLPAVNAGAGPADVVIAPDGSTAYVTDANSDTVTPINLRTFKPGKPIVVGNGPQGIVVTPDGSRAYVADAGAIIAGQSGTIGHDVTPIDLSTGKALTPIRVGNAPVGIAVTPDGSTVFVTNLNSESVTPITVASDTPGASIATAGGPVAVVVAHNDAWVVNTPAGGEGNNLQPISVTSGVAGKPIKLPNGAQNLAVLPNGSTAWVVCLNTDKLVAVNLVRHKVSAAIKIRGGPFAVAVAYQPRGAAPTTTTVPKSKKTKKTTTT
jgi:YVTN family beta-propeller protein